MKQLVESVVGERLMTRRITSAGECEWCGNAGWHFQEAMSCGRKVPAYRYLQSIL